jgi:NitT/TauT family transport system substrate-binding protein
MSCCDLDQSPWQALKPAKNLRRRAVLKGAAALASGALAAPAIVARAQGKSLKLAFCSQLLCIIPYTVAKSQGFYEKEGLDLELVYARGGGAAMEAFVGGAVDYGATALDVALEAYNKGAPIRRFLSTGKLPLFALAVAPKMAAQITTLKDLAGKTVGVSGLGNADHALALYLLKQAGVDTGKVQFATLGPNLLEALRQGAVDAGLVQEPALTLIVQSGGRVLVNAMDSADAKKYLGGNYEFMGVAVRAPEIPARREEMKALARALQNALASVQTLSPDDLVKSLPPEMTAGADTGQMRDILGRYRASLYPASVKIDLAAAGRVAASLKVAGLIAPDADPSGLYDTSIAGG